MLASTIMSSFFFFFFWGGGGNYFLILNAMDEFTSHKHSLSGTVNQYFMTLKRMLRASNRNRTSRTLLV